MKIKSGPVIHEINMMKLLILGPIFEELNDFQLMSQFNYDNQVILPRHFLYFIRFDASISTYLKFFKSKL